MGISFGIESKAETTPPWFIEEEYFVRDQGLHKDNYYAMLLEYAEGAITKDDLLRVTDIRIYVLKSYLRSEMPHHPKESVYKWKLSLLKFWEDKRDLWKKVAKDIEDKDSLVDEVRAKEVAKKIAIEYLISSYGYLQQNEKSIKRYKEIINQQKNETSNKNNGDNQ